VGQNVRKRQENRTQKSLPGQTFALPVVGDSARMAKPSGVKSLPGQTSALSAATGGAGVPGGARAKKYLNAALKKKVRERSRGKCEYNNCNKPAEHFHHTGRFSENHSHEGVIHVCKDHHQILHNGFVKNEQEPPQYWQLTLNQPLGYADDCYRKCREEALG